MEQKMSKVIFWDFDGTLVHPNERFVQTFRSAAACYNVDIPLDEIRALHGDHFEFLTGTVLNSQSHLDRLLGTDTYRIGGMDASQLMKAHAYGLDSFKNERHQYYLYRL